MNKKSETRLSTTIIGGIFTVVGVLLLCIKITGQYIPILQPHSFELFMISPIFVILGIRMVCKDIQKKTIHVFSDVLFGLAIVYLVILSAGWYTINIM